MNVYNLNEIVSYFPKRVDFYYGKSFLNDFSVAIPGSKVDFLGKELKNLLELDFAGEGVTVTAPGEGYVNFGIFGVIIHAAFLWFILWRCLQLFC